MITVKNLFFSYSVKQPLLNDISFSIKKGEFVALLGQNGSGKTTLIKLMLNLLQPNKGSITIQGTDVTKKKKWNDIGYVPQKISIDAQHPATVKEILQDTSMCSQLAIDSFLHKQFKDLSGGQQQRVLVALALENDPPILILDEPTVGIDEKTRIAFYDLLKHLAKKHHKTIIIVTHDNKLIKSYADKSLCFDDQHHVNNARCIHG